MLGVLLTILAVSQASANFTSSQLDELAVGIEFTEYDFEDFCATKSNIYWQFYRGSSSNLSAVSQQEFFGLSLVYLLCQLRAEITA